MTLRPDITAAASRLSAGFDVNRELRQLALHLREGESVLRLTAGVYGSGGGLLAVTNLRVLLLRDGRSGQASEGFPIGRLSAVEWIPGPARGTISVSDSVTVAELTQVEPREGTDVVAFIRSLMPADAGVPDEDDLVDDEVLDDEVLDDEVLDDEVLDDEVLDEVADEEIADDELITHRSSGLAVPAGVGAAAGADAGATSRATTATRSGRYAVTMKVRTPRDTPRGAEQAPARGMPEQKTGSQHSQPTQAVETEDARPRRSRTRRAETASTAAAADRRPERSRSHPADRAPAQVTGTPVDGSPVDETPADGTPVGPAPANGTPVNGHLNGHLNGAPVNGHVSGAHLNGAPADGYPTRTYTGPAVDRSQPTEHGTSGLPLGAVPVSALGGAAGTAAPAAQAQPAQPQGAQAQPAQAQATQVRGPGGADWPTTRSAARRMVERGAPVSGSLAGEVPITKLAEETQGTPGVSRGVEPDGFADDDTRVSDAVARNGRRRGRSTRPAGAVNAGRGDSRSGGRNAGRTDGRRPEPPTGRNGDQATEKGPGGRKLALLGVGATAVAVVVGLGVYGIARSVMGDAGTAVNPAPAAADAPAGPLVTVTRVIDADSIEVSGPVNGPVEILGISAPRTDKDQCGASDANAFANTTLSGSQVTLINDPSVPETDRTGRRMASVRTQTGFDYSVLAAKAGMARYYDSGKPVAQAEQIKAAQNEAEKAERGFWGAPCNGKLNKPGAASSTSGSASAASTSSSGRTSDENASSSGSTRGGSESSSRSGESSSRSAGSSSPTAELSRQARTETAAAGTR